MQGCGRNGVEDGDSRAGQFTMFSFHTFYIPSPIQYMDNM